MTKLPFLGEDGKYHFIYQTINTINGKWYVGRHTTKKLNDNYMGSGIALSSAIEKYGKENFIRSQMSFHNSYQELIEEEQKWIDLISILDISIVYNISKSSQGGYTGNYKNRKPMPLEFGKKLSVAKTGVPRKDLTKEEREKTLEGVQKLNNFRYSQKGKPRSFEDKKKKSEAALLTIQNGTHHSCFRYPCKFCGILVTKSNLKRWHDDNCKLNPDRK